MQTEYVRFFLLKVVQQAAELWGVLLSFHKAVLTPSGYLFGVFIQLQHMMKASYQFSGQYIQHRVTEI